MWVVSIMLQMTYSCLISPCAHWIWGCVASEAGLDLVGVEKNRKWNFSHPTQSHFVFSRSLVSEIVMQVMYCKIIPGVSLKNYIMTKVSWENVLLMISLMMTNLLRCYMESSQIWERASGMLLGWYKYTHTHKPGLLNVKALRGCEPHCKNYIFSTILI